VAAQGSRPLGLVASAGISNSGVWHNEGEPRGETAGEMLTATARASAARDTPGTLAAGWQVGLLVGVVGLLGLLYYWARPPVLPLADATVYVASAQALAAGQGYRLPGYLAAPPNTFYPPGYPLVLAGLFRVWPEFPANLPLLQAFALGAFYALLGLSVVVLRRCYGATWRDIALATLLAATTPMALKASTAIMSDSLYGVLVLASVLVVRAGWRQAGVRGLALLLAGALLGVAAFYTRTAGVVLVAALALDSLRRARGAGVGRMAVVVLPLLLVLPWLAWTTLGDDAGYLRHSVSGAGAYHLSLSSPANVARVVLGNLAEGADILWVVAPLFVDLWPLGVALLLYVAWRSGRAWWQGGDAIYLYLLLYLALMLVWPWRVPGRFLWPVAPVLAWYLVVGLRDGWTLALAAVRRPSARRGAPGDLAGSGHVGDRGSRRAGESPPLIARQEESDVVVGRPAWDAAPPHGADGQLIGAGAGDEPPRYGWGAGSRRGWPPIGLGLPSEDGGAVGEEGAGRGTRWGMVARRAPALVVGTILALNGVGLIVAAERVATTGWVGEPTPQATYLAMLDTVAYLRGLAPPDGALAMRDRTAEVEPGPVGVHAAPEGALATNHWGTVSWWHLYTGRRGVDAVARVDGSDGFFVRRALQGDPEQAVVFIYQRDNGPPLGAADDLETLRAALAARGAPTEPLYCAGDGAVCVFDWRRADGYQP
jgi:hypothetical protein